MYGEWIRLRSCVRATRRHRQIDCKNLEIGRIFCTPRIGSTDQGGMNMNKPMVGVTCAAAMFSLSIAAAQSGKTDSQPQSQTSTQQEMTLNGCVARGTTTGAQSATFMLNNAQATTAAAPGATVGGSTSAGAGVSAGQTPSSNPAGTTGTASPRTGTSGRTDPTTTRPAEPASSATPPVGTTSGNVSVGVSRTPSYTLVAGANQNLANYVGQRVEVRGRVMGETAGTTGDVSAGASRSAGSSASASGASADRPAMSRFQITSIRTISGTCQ